MKFKHLGRQVVALLLSLCLAGSLLPLSVSAVPSVGTGNGVGEAGSAGIVGVWDIMYSLNTTPFGCRVTLMDKSTGNRVPGVMSVDYTNDKSVADRVVMHAAKYCKSDYLKCGYGMLVYGVDDFDGYDAKTIDGLPQIIDNPNPTAVKTFFCTEAVLKHVAQDLGISYDELISGKYKLMIEPIHYFHKNGSTEEMAFTATEYAILAINGANYTSISNRTKNAIPLALFLEDDDTDLGYNEYTGDTNANWDINNKQNTWSTASDKGELRLGYQDIFNKSLGMAIVSFPENTQPHVYHHVYDIQVTVPKSFPLDSTGTLVGAAGAQKMFDNSKASGGLNATDAAAMLKLLQLDENKNKLDNINNWRILADYDLITENNLMGVYTESNKQKYYASKDNRYMAELSTKLDNYLAVSAESTIILDPTDAYPGPEISGYNSNTVVRRYGGTTDEKYRNTNTNTTYYGLEFDLSIVDGLMKALISSKDGTASTWYNDKGLTVANTAARDYHTATFALTFVNPPTTIYYHEITIEVDIPDGTPTPTTLDEVKKLIEDNPDITPEITWKQEKGETNEDKYNPYKDDKIKTGDLKTGVLVGTLGYTETTKVENDGTDVYPQQGKDGADPADKLENHPMDFDTLKNVKKIPNKAIDLVENTIDEIHTVVVKFDFNEPKAPTPADPTPDRIKTYDVAQFIDDTTSTASGSRHLDTLVGYADNETSYNNTAMSAASHISNKAEAAVIKSNVLSFEAKSEVKAKNHVNTTVIQCGPQSHGSHTVPHSYTDGEGEVHHYTTHEGGYSAGAINKYTCHYTKETVVIGYGLQVSQKKHFRDNSGSLMVESGYKSPAELANSGSFTDVGFTVPYKYYTDPDVVKLVGSNKYSGSQNHFLLPNVTGMPSQASKYAVFDTLFNRDSNKYWIKYFKGTEEVKYQSNKQTSEQQKQDYSNPTADLDFSYTGTNNNPIDGAQFIAHRDLLSGDKVSTSLAVSGYMAKYADNSNTKNYLEFMKKSGFYVTDPSNAISHANRTVCVANAALTNQLQGTKDGREIDAYNTDYTGGKSETNLTAQTHVRFGLGGLSADSVHLYNKYLSSSPKITDNSLDREAEEGDALRSIWYTNQESEGRLL